MDDNAVWALWRWAWQGYAGQNWRGRRSGEGMDEDQKVVVAILNEYPLCIPPEPGVECRVCGPVWSRSDNVVRGAGRGFVEQDQED